MRPPQRVRRFFQGLPTRLRGHASRYGGALWVVLAIKTLLASSLLLASTIPSVAQLLGSQVTGYLGFALPNNPAPTDPNGFNPTLAPLIGGEVPPGYLNYSSTSFGLIAGNLSPTVTISPPAIEFGFQGFKNLGELLTAYFTADSVALAAMQRSHTAK